VVSPTKPGTTAGRLIEKRGDGGYMIIMQTEDAKKRREYIEAKGHPKGIKGTLGTRSKESYASSVSLLSMACLRFRRRPL